MPKPEPIWERWKQENPERIFYLYWATIISVNALLFMGAVMFIILMVYR